MARLRLRQARVQRLNTLIRHGAGQGTEAADLRVKLKGKFEIDANEEHILKRWREAVEKQRRRAWNKYVQTNNASGGGKLFKWVQRAQMETHLTQLSAQNPTGENTLSGRLQSAAATWHLLWKGGKAHTPSHHTALRPLSGGDLSKVLRKLSEGKAKGTDGWSPKEILSLPHSWLGKLAEFYNTWEKRGKWPQVLNNSIIALVPKAGATHEGQLRPIGIMPYIYRLWMAARRIDAKDWSLSIHGGKHLGAAALAYDTQVRIEKAHWAGEHVLIAFLDCSKCYERIEHSIAGQDTVATGCPDTIANMVFHQYAGNRIVRAHGAAAKPLQGNHGLIAGCSYAKDILKAFLIPTAGLVTNTVLSLIHI